MSGPETLSGVALAFKLVLGGLAISGLCCVGHMPLLFVGIMGILWGGWLGSASAPHRLRHLGE